MIISLMMAAAQFAVAFFVLDFSFVWMDVTPGGLKTRLWTYCLRYAAIGLFACAPTVVMQWREVGWWAAALAPLDALPWWLLWRFGLRKQLTFLFKDDGGRPLDSKNPDL